MKKRNLVKGGALAGSLLLASAVLSGCTRHFEPPPAVYGPPPDFETPEPAARTEEPAPDYDPSLNIPAPVYGPPPTHGG